MAEMGLRGMLGGARTVDEGVRPTPIGRGRGYSPAVGVVGDVALYDTNFDTLTAAGIGGHLCFAAARSMPRRTMKLVD